MSSLARHSARLLSSSAVSNTSASRAAQAANATKAANAVQPTPTVATSQLLKQTREDALWTPGLTFRDEEQVSVGHVDKADAIGLVEADLRPVDEGGRDTQKMKWVVENLRCITSKSDLRQRAACIRQSGTLKRRLSKSIKGAILIASVTSRLTLRKDPSSLIFGEDVRTAQHYALIQR